MDALDDDPELRHAVAGMHESIARRVARLCSAYDTALADGFAAATAQELGVRLHTTDRSLVDELRRAKLSVTLY